MKILMIGPDFRVVGGMTSLNKMIMEEHFEDFSVDFSASMHDSSLIGRFSQWAKNLFIAPVKRFSKKKPDVVHIHVSTGLSLWRKTSIGNLWSILGVPVIYHTHGSKIKDFIGKSSKLTRGLIARRFRRADMTLTLSEGWKEWYSSALDLDLDKINVIPTPIKIPNEEPSLRGEDILYSGLMGNRKGTFDLIRAWALIPKESRNESVLHLIGNGKVKQAAELVNELNLGDSCIVHGWVSEEEKKRLIGRSGIYVLPSYNEGLPMGLLEAMAWGLAPISTNVGAIPEIIADGINGFLVDPGDIDTLSNRICELMEDASKKHKIAISANKTARKHDWADYVVKIQDIWNSVIES